MIYSTRSAGLSELTKEVLILGAAKKEHFHRRTPSVVEFLSAYES